MSAPCGDLLTGEKGAPQPERLRALARPIPVAAASIYTRSDGVVAWQACLEPERTQSENIEVRTTHLGLGFHAPALWVIADRLAQRFGTWRPFSTGAARCTVFPATRLAHGSVARAFHPVVA